MGHLQQLYLATFLCKSAAWGWGFRLGKYRPSKSGDIYVGFFASGRSFRVQIETLLRKSHPQIRC